MLKAAFLEINDAVEKWGVGGVYLTVKGKILLTVKRSFCQPL